MFRLILETTERIDVACLPVGVFFWEFVRLEPQNLTPGTYRVVVEGADTISASFELEPDSSYQEARVTEVEVVVLESFTANVIVLGELRGACGVVDGAIQQRRGTDRHALPDDEFLISLISHTTETCSGETVSFEEIIPVSSYGSGNYTVNVDGVVETFTFP